MAYEYTTRVVPMGMPAGRALNALKQAIVPDYYTGGLWMNYVDCNIYGDPSTTIYKPELRVHNITQDIRYSVIQWAIDEAENGDEIVLDPGPYTGIGNRDIDFLGKAVTIRSTDPGNPGVVASTVIDCGNKDRAFKLWNIEEGNPVISGLTITNGTGYVTYCRQSSPTITNCVFYNNSGRAIYLDFSDAVISHCAFTGNGGGIYNSGGSIEVTDCTFTDNVSGAVSSSCSSSFDNCAFINNSAKYGGAVLFHSSYDHSPSFFNNCTFTSNSASQAGGAFYSAGAVTSWCSASDGNVIFNCLS